MGNRPAIEAGDQPCLSRARTIVCSRGERSTASFLGPLPRGGGLLVGLGGPVAVAAAVAGDLPGDDRRITTDSSGDLLVLQAFGQPAGDLLPVEHGQHLAHGEILFPPNTKIKCFDRLNSR